MDPADPFAKILASLDSVPWHLAPSVTAIKPREHRNLNFFPGQRGFVGPWFPVGGIMVIANNFDNLSNWIEYRDDFEHVDSTNTWRRLRIMMEASELPSEDFWFTNYCLGVMEKPRPIYDFPPHICAALQFGRVFAECVAAMKPRLIVSLGENTSECLGLPWKPREFAITSRVIEGRETRLLAAAHPSAWPHQYPDAYFQALGISINELTLP